MKKTSLLVSAALMLFSGLVNAHGPVRAKLTATILIDAPAAKVWDVVKNYDDMSWHPSIKSVKGDGSWRHFDPGRPRTLVCPAHVPTPDGAARTGPIGHPPRCV